MPEPLGQHAEMLKNRSHRYSGLDREVKMKKRNVAWTAFIVVLTIGLLTLTCSAVQGEATDSDTRIITDIADREVAVPTNVDSIATDGAVPVLNSFMFLMGKGDMLAYTTPSSSEYLFVVEPGLKDKPKILGNIELEELIKVNPDVVFTASRGNVDSFSDRGLTVVFLPMPETDIELVKNVVRVLEKVFDEQERGEKYIKYLDDTIARVDKVISSMPEDQRLKVLYCNYKSMTAHHRWWIEKAGGISVSKNDILKRVTFDLEGLTSWDPDVMFVSNSDINEVYNETRLSSVSAVKNNRVYAIPSSLGPWGYSCEQPLMLLLTAKTLYPEQFKDINMESEIISFFKEFYNYDMTKEQAAEILNGK